MFRKITLALAAATVVATAAIPTAASAYWDGGRYSSRPGVSVTVGSPYRHYAFAPRCHYVKRWVHTHWGWKRHMVRRCY